MRFHSLVFITSEACNLNCKYCYIANTKNDTKSYYLEEHNKITKSLEDNSYINNYLKLLNRLKLDPKAITAFELWGQEPTMNLEKLFDNFDYLYKAFPNVKRSVFSTNGVSNLHKIINAITTVDDIVEQEFTFSIQFSIDGAEYTKENRGIDVNIILSNIENMLKELNQIKLQKVKVKIHLHNVISSNVFNELTTIEQIDNYWDELNQYAINLQKINKNKNVFFEDLCFPALEMPIKATQQDGINLYNFFYYSSIGKGKNNVAGLIRRLNKQSEFFKKENLNINDLLVAIKDVKAYDIGKVEQYNNLSKNCGCGNQSASLKMAYDGDLMFCQTAMFKKREEDFENYVDESDGYFHSLVKHNRYVNGLTAPIEEVINYFKFYEEYALTAFGIKFTNSLNLLIWLSEVDLVDPIYKINKEKLLKHAFICAGIQNCAQDDIIETGSLYGRSADLVKLYCNGVLGLVEDFTEREKL